MKKILEKIKKKFTLIVSLPQNSVSLAKVAEEGGADALKIHLNLEHRAANVKFGSFKEERKNIEEILKEVNIPVGIVPGAEKVCSEEEILELENMGIDFFDIYIKDAPIYLLRSNFTKMFALSHNFELEEVKFLEKLGVDILEASIISPEGYGKEMTLLDLIRYKQIISNTKKPVVIPTQRKISLRDLQFLKKISASGIIIGAVVFGKEKNEIKNITSEYKKAITKIYT